MQPDAPLSIVEFSPNWDTSRGGAKVRPRGSTRVLTVAPVSRAWGAGLTYGMRPRVSHRLVAQILVCLSGDHATLQRLRSKELPAQCQFGALTVPAECVAPGVLRCIGA